MMPTATRRLTILISMLVLGCAMLARAGDGALAHDAPPAAAAPSSVEAAAGPPESAEPMFDELKPRADVIYLLANSSLVFGPDPHARSEEITFAGLVTVPKYPMAGYQRRTLADGRQQIDMELTSSTLTGESYLLGGTVKLGEHPDLRSLGTITQRRPVLVVSKDAGSATAYGLGDQEVREPARSEANTLRLQLPPDIAKVVTDNPDILWDDLLSTELKRLAKNSDAIRSRKMEPKKIVLPPETAATTLQIAILPDVATALAADPAIEWNIWAADRLVGIIEDLRRRNIITGSRGPRNVIAIPNDFVVARKVLITTAKGILYNETPVPVRGVVDAIPPIKEPDTPLGVNVFRGMELPIPLLDKDGNVDGWFYSKAHMAFAVLPDAIQRNEVEGSVQFEVDGRREAVAVKGPIEIHHRTGKGDTEIEVLVLALRGHSALLGGEVMMIEAFSDRDHFSRGSMRRSRGGGGPLQLDLYTEIYTPSGKLTNPVPIRLKGTVGGVIEQTPVERGPLHIAVVTATGRSTLKATAGSDLVDESGRTAAHVAGFEVNLRSVVER